MARELKLQDPGEGISEAEIVEVLVSVGDHVDDGDTVLTVETDKATSEVASPFSGDVTSIDVEVGQTVSVGDVLMQFSNGEGRAEESEAEKSDQEKAEKKAEKKERKKAEKAEKAEKKERKKAEKKERKKAEKADREDGEDSEDRREAETEEARRTPAGEDRAGPVPASPATRRRARELGVDLREVQASGAHGQVTTEDVERSAQGEPSESEADEQPRAAEATAPAEDADRWGPVERVPLRGVRKAIARQMSMSWGPIARVTHHDMADVTELERLRRRHVERVEAMSGDLTLLVLTMKAVAATLRAFPRLNASLDDEAADIVLKRYVHLGIAVDTDDGLLVPVVRDVDRKSVTDLARELPDLLRRTRARDLGREEMQGASFTITNVGPLGGTSFTPMVDHPQVAILGMARAHLEPRVTHGDIDDDPGEVVVEARYVLPLSLSFDHRVVDGADAARFVSALVQSLSDPERLLLSL